MDQIWRHPLGGPALFLLVFVVSRLVLGLTGLTPDGDIITANWQHADLNLLASDPFGTLWHLHSQPPMWNAIIAVVVQIVGPAPEAVTGGVHVLNMLLTVGSGLLVISIGRAVGLSAVVATLVAMLVVMSPSVIYYENVVFYPQLTYFLMTLFVWLIVRHDASQSLVPAIAALGVMVVLSWTWAVFHPLFIGLLGCGLAYWRGKSVSVFGAAVLATALALAPTVKNSIQFGTPSASTWVGMNLAQTAPALSDDEKRMCNFFNAHDDMALRTFDAPHASRSDVFKSSGQANMNVEGLIARGHECLDVAKANILVHPGAWAQQRFAALTRSHQNRPFNYETPPNNWERIFAPVLSTQDALGPVGRTLNLGFYILVWFLAIKQFVRSPSPQIAVLMATAVYFTFVTHIANGGEQERMRLTIEPIYLIFILNLLAERLRRSSGQPETSQRSNHDAEAISA